MPHPVVHLHGVPVLGSDVALLRLLLQHQFCKWLQLRSSINSADVCSCQRPLELWCGGSQWCGGRAAAAGCRRPVSRSRGWWRDRHSEDVMQQLKAPARGPGPWVGVAWRNRAHRPPLARTVIFSFSAACAPAMASSSSASAAQARRDTIGTSGEPPVTSCRLRIGRSGASAEGCKADPAMRSSDAAVACRTARPACDTPQCAGASRSEARCYTSAAGPHTTL